MMAVRSVGVQTPWISRAISKVSPLADVRMARELAMVACGVLLVSALAQVVIRLPWTPVPITGQTFGVTLMALLWGRRRALGVMVSYIALGGLGLPVFAAGAAGLVIGPTLGYLVGMILSSVVVGELSDRGYAKNWASAMAVAILGSGCVLTCGLVALSFFVPTSTLLVAGVLPFLPGDFLKNSLACYLAVRAQRILN